MRIFLPSLHTLNTLLSSVTISIYNRAGERERLLVENELLPEGVNAVKWDGMQDDGRPVPSNLYIISVEAIDEKEFITVGVANR